MTTTSPTFGFPAGNPDCCPECPDGLVIPALRAIRNCVAEQFAVCDRMPCRFPITWNEQQPPADACDCFCGNGQGQAWVRWVSTDPGKVAGGKGMAAAGCADGTYEMTFEVGVYRCWPVPGEAKPLDETEEEQAAAGMLLDAAAMRRALRCCEFLEDQSWELIKQEPVAHSGGCTGVSTQLRVINSDCGCSDSSSAPRNTAPGLNSRGQRPA